MQNSYYVQSGLNGWGIFGPKTNILELFSRPVKIFSVISPDDRHLKEGKSDCFRFLSKILLMATMGKGRSGRRSTLKILSKSDH